ncbi:MAG: RNA replicase beta chain [Sanya fiers-like virus 39]|nr:MAG: RNA replicase beta chain [Sanya fiers-like virus 39]
MTQSCRSIWGYAPPIVSYDGTLSTELSNEILGKLARSLLDGLSPAGWLAGGIGIADCITSGDFPSLCVYDPDVLDLTPADQLILNQCLAFFRKRKDIDIGVDRKAAALAKFREAESACRVTNACFRAWNQGRFQFHPDVEAVLHGAQRKISELVGDAPSLREIRPRLGPGATTQVPKRNACPVVKLEHAPACSANFTRPEEALGTIFCTDGEEATMDLEIHPSRVAFVDKNAKTERAICTEPSLNGMFQLGLGDEMARRLRAVGIDLKDQSANQRAALYGSLSNESATVDLSSASDTVSLLLVEHLFPEPWYLLFCRLRTALTEVDGGIMVLEKMSSMGNGFTFPLETIIFWAIAQSVKDRVCKNHRTRVLVYGDDIVVPSDAVPLLFRTLKAVGFTPNWQKSFWNGPFRESCGHDYVLGHSVRPVFVDDALSGDTVFTLINGLNELGFRREADRLQAIIDPSILRFGPAGYGDGHIVVDDWMQYSSPHNRRDGWEGYTFETWAFRPKRLKSAIAKHLATPVKGRDVLSSGRRLDYSSRKRWLVRRLATYVAYMAESPNSDDVRDTYAHRMMPDPLEARDDVRFFVTPGRGKVTLNRVYIFASTA